MRKVLRALLVILGLYWIGSSLFLYWKSRQVNDFVKRSYVEHHIQEITMDPTSHSQVGIQAEKTEEPIQTGVIGILKIPKIKIEYPMMRGKDNDYYLSHDAEGNKSVYGAIFWDYKGRPLIFGHNMKDGSMFGKLKNLKQGDLVIIDEQKFEVEQIKVKSSWEVMTIDTLALVTCKGENRLVLYLKEEK